MMLRRPETSATYRFMIESLHISDEPKKLHPFVTKPRVARYIYVTSDRQTQNAPPDTTMENNVLTIFTRIRQRLHTTARSIAGEDNADDVLQDAFCKLWTLKNMPPDQQQTERIAATIVKNVSIDYLRSAHRSVQPATVCGATDDAKEQDMRERFDAVKRIVEMQLSDTQRCVLWMRDYEGYSFAEIAAAVDMTEENVRQTLSRARKQIRETYKNIN